MVEPAVTALLALSPFEFAGDFTPVHLLTISGHVRLFGRREGHNGQL